MRIVYVELVHQHLEPLREVFAPLVEAMAELYSRYNAEELQLILDYLGRSAKIPPSKQND